MANCKKSSVLLLLLISIGFMTSETYGIAVMSVDLGSEWMKVAIVSPGVPMEIALNKESKRKTPMVISFRDEERTFGEDAQVVGTRFPKISFQYILDLVGKSIENPIVQLFMKRFPYYDIESDNERNTIVFRIDEKTIYTPEELLAQILHKAREFAQNSAGQKINEAVITVPGFFNQVERLAILQAADLANIKILQLFNDYSAVALNYGIFNRKQINDTAHYVMFYDMGASSTTATVVGYQNIKTKERGFLETHPQVSILGVGYDRTLGGLEMQIRLRDYLAKEFDAMKKTSNSVFKNPRAMAKLFKEAGRVKNVLSANNDHYAQIEGVIDEKDFRLQVTREKFEELCVDLFERVANPVKTALETSGLTMDIISQVVLVGAGTRVPKIQEKLSAYLKTELAKNINADEAAALGAVYKAADLSQGFKVKKFITKDAVLFPIQIVFDRTVENNKVKQVRRTLFSKMNAYPQKKIITFNKHNHDFSFDINYAELDYLSKEEIAAIGNLNISTISLSGVAEAMAKHSKEAAESKGIKAHFAMDESGVLNLVNVELVSEKTSVVEEEGAFSKLGSTIRSEAKEAEKVTLPPKDDIRPVYEEPDEYPEPKKESDEKAKAENETKSPEGQTENKTEKIEKEIKPTIVTLKEPIKAHEDKLGPKTLSEDKFLVSKEKLSSLDKHENERVRRESALNSLESFVIDAQQKLETEEYQNALVPTDAEKIKKACNEVSEWLYEEGFGASADTYEEKLYELQKLTADVNERVFEHKERPEALKGMLSMINGSRTFLTNMKNLNVSSEIFTQIEIETLEKVINETEEYHAMVIKASSEMKLYEPVLHKVRDIANKMAMLDREVKYLVNKAKIWKPKQEPTSNNAEEISENKTNASASDDKKEFSGKRGRDEAETLEAEETLELPISDTAEAEDDDSKVEHQEL
ncbi:hypoxia up-regulated protein 1 isoform X2 [Phymastichus coffea]|uniref:hypoxia up-regulated protein 1 isoform X2 n=1 Tax=Phymastichus coffea TaxID=108790 RepID=UPI00273BD46C|nr:hypoxia up-regulated protein 1 isoform X2 [Phymastichus coffea]